jgi:nitrogen regulatory protein P-II 1
MKEIKAIVQSAKVQKIHDAFHSLKGFPGICATRVEWFGPHLHGAETPKEELTDFSKRTLLAVLAPDDLLEEIVRILIGCTYTGQSSDGTIWISSVERTIEIGQARPG